MPGDGMGNGDAERFGTTHQDVIEIREGLIVYEDAHGELVAKLVADQRLKRFAHDRFDGRGIKRADNPAINWMGIERGGVWPGQPFVRLAFDIVLECLKLLALVGN